VVGAAGDPRGLVWAGPSRPVPTSRDPVQRDGPSLVVSWLSVLGQVSCSRSGVAAGMVVSEPWCRGRRARPGPAAGADARPPRLCSGVGQRGGRVPPTRHGGGAAAGRRPPSGDPEHGRRGCAPPAEPGRCWPRRRSRRSCQLSRLSGAPIRVSSAPMASSSRTRTRCAPRTSRVFAVIPTAGPPRSGPAPSPGPDNALPRRGSDPAQ